MYWCLFHICGLPLIVKLWFFCHLYTTKWCFAQAAIHLSLSVGLKYVIIIVWFGCAEALVTINRNFLVCPLTSLVGILLYYVLCRTQLCTSLSLRFLGQLLSTMSRFVVFSGESMVHSTSWNDWAKKIACCCQNDNLSLLAPAVSRE